MAAVCLGSRVHWSPLSASFEQVMLLRLELVGQCEMEADVCIGLLMFICPSVN